MSTDTTTTATEPARTPVRRRSAREELKTDIAIGRAMAVQELQHTKAELADAQATVENLDRLLAERNREIGALLETNMALIADVQRHELGAATCPWCRVREWWRKK